MVEWLAHYSVNFLVVASIIGGAIILLLFIWFWVVSWFKEAHGVSENVWSYTRNRKEFEEWRRWKRRKTSVFLDTENLNRWIELHERKEQANAHIKCAICREQMEFCECSAEVANTLLEDWYIEHYTKDE